MKHREHEFLSALRRLENFYPLQPQEMSRLVARLHGWMDELATERGDPFDVFTQARRGEIGPRPQLKIVNLDRTDGPKREEWHE